jgi:hypothetical protein
MSAVRLGSRKTRWVLAVVGVACVVILTAYIVFLRGGELGDKPIYADLQGLELTQRSSVLTEPTVVLQGETGPILGIPTDDAPMRPHARNHHRIRRLRIEVQDHVLFAFDDSRVIESNWTARRRMANITLGDVKGCHHVAGCRNDMPLTNIKMLVSVMSETGR